MNARIEPDNQPNYLAALEQEKRTYQDCREVHDLPAVFHYWSEQHLRPKLLPYGFDSPNAMFRKYLEEQSANNANRHLRVVSLGAGNCDLEIDIALHLRDRGRTGFTIDCLDLNPAMLERGRVNAAVAGVAGEMRFLQSDLNSWQPEGEYDAAMANQTLHHVVNLEGLFDRVGESLKPDGQFIISDMIGRNGHQRWPEALAMVREFWGALPPSYRYNRRFRFYDEQFEDWDCSVEGFEGVRAQDILRLLLDRFHFLLFIPFGNLIDPFIDRLFGHNFDAGNSWDRAFIDRVHHRDEQELACGRLTPTHMLAVVATARQGPPAFPANLSPQFCLRSRGMERGSQISGGQTYQWGTWPHSADTELATACERLADAGLHIRRSTLRTLELEKELDERTKWALGLREELESRTAWALRLRSDLEERTAWGLRLEKELEERTAWALRLDKDYEESSAWALRLRDALQLQTQRAAKLETELRQNLRNPLYFALRFVARAYGFLRRIRL